ncbi:nuclear transport factor 2 family protein [Oribacterium sp. P6A1]|uniref:nuclear transport factor 2 family protein n=1 Tax=Oribacterium sp. P6A1 TaxID=1410612 RepID=UPI000564683C|nr:nuclear transport factor 2 family protein [Oribacterium sp. P6A1]
MIEKNIEGLRSLMSADYCLYHMTGVRQSADEFIEGLKNGTFNYYSAEHEDIAVSVDGDEATIEEMAEIAKLDKNERYYHRTDEQLIQFAGWKPDFEK